MSLCLLIQSLRSVSPLFCQPSEQCSKSVGHPQFACTCTDKGTNHCATLCPITNTCHANEVVAVLMLCVAGLCSKHLIKWKKSPSCQGWSTNIKLFMGKYLSYIFFYLISTFPFKLMYLCINPTSSTCLHLQKILINAHTALLANT